MNVHTRIMCQDHTIVTNVHMNIPEHSCEHHMNDTMNIHMNHTMNFHKNLHFECL